MKKTDFFEKLKDAMETETEINGSTVLKSIPEYSSLTTLLIIALIDEHFNKVITAKSLSTVDTIDSLINIIGSEHFE